MDTTRKKFMTKSLVLLDADIIIFLHELNYWNAIIKNYEISIASTVIGEVKFYINRIEGTKIPIDLRSFIAKGVVKEVSITAQEVKEVFDILREAPPLDGINAGELESIAILYFTKDQNLKMGVEDGLAVMALSYFELDDKACRLQDILKNCGIDPKVIADRPQFSHKRFNNLLTEGKFLLVKYPPKSK